MGDGSAPMHRTGTDLRRETGVPRVIVRRAIPELILETRVIAIGRNIPRRDAPRIAEALANGGMRAIELTLNKPEDEALRSIEVLARVADDLRIVVGAGTVLSTDAAARAANAGARFMVAPDCNPGLIRWCAAQGLPSFPGALSPTEILAAWSAGASAVKLFPAVTVGPGYIKQIAGPLPDIPFVPTGGVSAENAGSWIAAGAVAVGIGSWLIGDGEASGVTERARLVSAVVAGGPGQSAPAPA